MDRPTAPDRPNILLVTSDQHRADSSGCYGNPVVRTPHLDRVSYAGTRFDNAYSDAPVCVPARTTLITGRQAHRNGMPSYAEEWRLERPRELFLGSLLTAAGYQTHLVGKTHWHTEPTFRAGFESVVSRELLRKERLLHDGRANDPTGLGHNELSPSLSQLPPRLCSSDWVVDRCLDFLDFRERGQPFALWASFLDPHPPLAIHEPYYSMYRDADIPEPVTGDWADGEDTPHQHFVHRWSRNPGPMSRAELREARAVYYGMITNLDHQLGRLIGRLQREGLWEETLVVYTTDHGEFLGDHGSAAKSSFCEASARIPFLVRPPRSSGAPAGQASDALVELADVLPTLCDYAGAAIPADVTGRSLRGILEGREERVRDTLHGQIDGTHMFHDGRYKYLYDTADGSELVFDLAADRDDLTRVTGEPLERLRAGFTAHLAAEGHGHLRDGRPLNRGLARPSVSALRAASFDALGLQPVGDHHWT